MQRKLNVLVVEPNKLPYEALIPNTLTAKQEIVKGNIEYVYLKNNDDVCLICNEEGKILDMEPNRTIDYDIIVGPFIIVSNEFDDGEDRSLSKKQIDKYKKYFDENSIIKTQNHLNVLSIKNKILEI